MPQFFHLLSSQIVDQARTGAAIIRVNNSVSQTTPGSEWAKFDGGTRQWLFDNGYRYDGAPDGKVPPEIDIIPVYDTPTKMHVRVPYSGDLANGIAPGDDTYGNSFPAFLAKYFMRRCR